MLHSRSSFQSLANTIGFGHLGKKKGYSMIEKGIHKGEDSTVSYKMISKRTVVVRTTHLQVAETNIHTSHALFSRSVVQGYYRTGSKAFQILKLALPPDTHRDKP